IVAADAVKDGRPERIRVDSETVLVVKAEGPAAVAVEQVATPPQRVAGGLRIVAQRFVLVRVEQLRKCHARRSLAPGAGAVEPSTHLVGILPCRLAAPGVERPVVAGYRKPEVASAFVKRHASGQLLLAGARDALFVVGQFLLRALVALATFV